MRKFLRLIEDNNPDAAAARYTFTLTMRNETGDVNETLVREIDDHSAAGDLWADIGDIFRPPVEDQEGVPDIDAAVEAQAAADPTGPAAVALKDRQAAAEAIVATFMADTEQMKQAASGKGSSPAVVGGGGSFGSSQ